MDAMRFIAAHGQWKFRIRDAIARGKSDFTVVGAKSDTTCDFGKFLQTLPAAVASSALGQKVRAKHAEFHVEAARVLELALVGKKADADKALVDGSKFAKLSTELSALLMEWQRTSAA
jgi:methyl-accepting chemotaxis protein